jgi:hypothetical protein
MQMQTNAIPNITLTWPLREEPVPDCAPSTRQELACLSRPSCNEMLEYYQLAVPATATVMDRRKELGLFLGRQLF